ncbi:amidohydrolase family protein [Thauera sp. CAU 1555]|uniref:Amidohydrolase family protein n=1 Tax=Thauera sedimentorum TaxID=2767595 RepID=A0ABR9BC85_9RHOO|nr:amidohydrolase family protein [Thauera sedimentorum]MBC9073034.1 amidohydrolase family protein [Thauera sedimentorum]MBD8503953.1 amidohydrolase family protein [Thauera sedimentorum]
MSYPQPNSKPNGFSPARRRWLRAGLAAGALAATGGAAVVLAQPKIFNPCLSDLPDDLAGHPLVAAAWRGLDPTMVWDCHAHLAGTGDGGHGIVMSPDMLSPLNPLQYIQRLFYLNAGCVHQAPGRVDDSYVERLHNLSDGMAPGYKTMLFAFDRAHAADGTPLPDKSALYVPNSYARDVARATPERFEWVCSIHPYRADALDALAQAAAEGARAVKWLPPAMGIDPASPACDPFYRALVELDLPLITHVGEEQAVHGAGRPEWSNPLHLRRALDHGVRVVMAHCASIGEDVDLDKGANGPRVPSFALFDRMMGEDRYKALLFGDISAIELRNRRIEVVRTIIEREDWHPRLLYGTDYPLPGILPLISPAAFAHEGMLDEAAVPVLEEIRAHNPLLFTFVLKRHLSSHGRRLPASVFETRRFFDRTTA